MTCFSDILKLLDAILIPGLFIIENKISVLNISEYFYCNIKNNPVWDDFLLIFGQNHQLPAILIG